MIKYVRIIVSILCLFAICASCVACTDTDITVGTNGSLYVNGKDTGTSLGDLTDDISSLPCGGAHTPGEWGEIQDGVQKKLCTVCSAVVDVKVVMDTPQHPCANGHTPGEWENAVDASPCIDSIRQKRCTVCAAVIEVEIVPGTGHTVSEDFEDDMVITKEPTCTVAGTASLVCITCNKPFFNLTLYANGHGGEWVTVTPPTSLTEGKAVKVCPVCGETETKTLGKLPDACDRPYDNLPAGLDYHGKKITVMYWSDAENIEFEIKSVTGDNVSDAIFDRNNRIEDRLNVDLLWMGEPGNALNRKSFVQRVSSYAQSGQSKVDIIATYSQTAASLAVQGLLIDLATIQDSHLDLDMPWWPSQMVENMSFGNSYYFLTGDISTNVLHMMHALYVNKDMMSRFDKKIEDVYKMVYDGTWTLDALIELTSGVYRELDGKNGKTAGDQYGLTGRSYVLDAFYIGSNMRYLVPSEESVFAISEDFGSLKTGRLVQKLGAQFAGDDWITMKFGDEPDYDAAVNDLGIFCAGRAMVIQQHFQTAEKTMVGKVDFGYGVLPMPKYDEKQVNYYTSLGNPHSIYGLFAGLDNRGDKEATLSMLSAVLECWASEGYRLTTPEIFEVNMPLKYSEGQDETNMFEYVRMGITMDLGRPMTAELLTISQQVGKCISSNALWEPYYGVYSVELQDRLNDVIEDYKWYVEFRVTQ